MHRFTRYATASLLAIAMLGYVVRADVPQVPTGTWAPGGQVGDIPRDVASAVLPDGRLLVTGGSSADGQPLPVIAAYDPASGTWSSATQMTEARAGHTATVLADGRVLITGGRTTTGLTASVEIYDPATGTSTTTGVLSVPRADHAAARLADGRVLIVGGSDGAAVLATAEIFDPATGSISQLPGSLVTARAKHSATALLDGHVLVAGGNDGTQDLASAEIFDAVTETFALTASLNAPRSGHVAILLPHNNDVLIAGGTSDGNTLASVERFSDWNGAFLPDATTMTTARSGAVSVPTPRDGVVLVAGGGSAQSEFYGFATLKTDKDDYAPGEIVTFTGSGWQPGETVKLTVSEDADTHDDFVFEAVADQFGNIVNTEFYPREDEVYHHMGARFYATARGIASEALITFTDAGTLTINFAGDGSGSVSGSGAGHQPADFVAAGCTSAIGSCSLIYTSNGSVVLTATEASGSSFTGWSSNVQFDPVKNEYSVKMDGNKTITATFVRSNLNQTITFGPIANKTYGDADFNVTATASSGLPVTFTATGSCSVSGNTVHITAAGSCTITANQAGGGQYNPAPTVQQSFTIAQATPVVAVTGGSFKYDGAAHEATATAKFNGVDVAGTFSFTYNGSSPAPINVANYAVVATFTSTDANFKNATGNGNVTITKADAVVVVNAATFTYDGQPHGATGTATGVTGEDLGSLLDLGEKFTNAPGGTANWSFAGNGNYNSQSGSVAITINKADATVTVNGATVTFDGLEHGASGTATGVGGENLNSLLNLGAKFTDVPGGTANWTFAGNGNYNPKNGSVAITINKANATVTVTGGEHTYDGQPHGATGSATGVGNTDLTSCLNLGEQFTNYPGGTAHWTFTGGTNYEDASGSAEITIKKAVATVNVTGGEYTYDGQAHGATGSAKGVGGADLSSGLNLGATFTDVPGGTAHWSFTGGTNYEDASGSVEITIKKAVATVNVTGGEYAYDGQAHGATGSAKGVGGADLSGGLNLGATFTDVPGGTAHWSFTGGTNYEDASGSVEITIKKAVATVNVTGGEHTYDGQPHGATGSAKGVGGADLSSGLNLGATFTDVPGGTANWTFTGGTNYEDASGSAEITIKKAVATVNVAGGEYTYDGQAHGATGSAKGVGGADLPGGLNLGATFTNVPGGTAHWSFTGGTNYEDASGSVEIKINKATPVVTVSGATFTYNGQPHPASATAAGVSGSVTGAFSFTYNGSASEPVNAGTYGVVATFTSADGNYDNATGAGTITINKANAVIDIVGGTYTYNGEAWGAHGTATSVTGMDLSGLLNFGEKFTNVPGGTAKWTFPGDANHNPAEGTATIVINKAPQTINVTTPAPSNALYNTSFTVAASGGGSGNPVTFGAGGSCSVVSATFTMTSGYGQCTVTFNQAGNNNYLDAAPVLETVNATAWEIGGFYSPVTPSTPANPIWNVVKGGSTVPLKFEIFAGVNGAEQTSVSAIKSILLQAVNCTGGTALNVNLSELDNTGGTSLRYDGSQFIQNWKTPTATGCFAVSMTAADNSTITAYFRTK